MMTFCYSGADDIHENGVHITYNFNSRDLDLDSVLTHFQAFLKSVQYSPRLVDSIRVCQEDVWWSKK